MTAVLEAPADAPPDLASRATALRDKIEALRAAEGVAVLEGGTLDTSERRAAEDELEAVEAAQSETVRRERAAADAERAASRRQLQAEVARLDGERRAAITGAEAACRAMVAELAKAEKAAAAEVQTIAALGRRRFLSLPEHKTRLARHVSAVMSAVTGPSQHFGEIVFHAAWTKASEDWLHHEASFAMEIAEITGERE